MRWWGYKPLSITCNLKTKEMEQRFFKHKSRWFPIRAASGFLEGELLNPKLSARRLGLHPLPKPQSTVWPLEWQPPCTRISWFRSHTHHICFLDCSIGCFFIEEFPICAFLVQLAVWVSRLSPHCIVIFIFIFSIYSFGFVRMVRLYTWVNE